MVFAALNGISWYMAAKIDRDCELELERLGGYKLAMQNGYYPECGVQEVYLFEDIALTGFSVFQKLKFLSGFKFKSIVDFENTKSIVEVIAEGSEKLFKDTARFKYLIKSISNSARKLGFKTKAQVTDFADSVRRFAGNNIGAVGKIDDIAEASSIISKKADYILGKATGSAHNIERSKSMLRQMERIGLPDTPQTRGTVKDHLIKTLKDPSSIKNPNLEGGRVLRESLLSGKNGHLKVESIWDGNKLITVKLKGGR